jgi:hypothetical protein
VRLEGLDKLKKSNDLIENRNRDLSACSIMPEPTALPRAIAVATIGLICKQNGKEIRRKTRKKMKV